MNRVGLKRTGCFVSGTDTGVGKTFIAAGLAAVLRSKGIDVGVMKPVQTGITVEQRDAGLGDGAFMRRVAGVDDPISLISPACLKHPLAPLVAARLEDKPIDLLGVAAAFRTLKEKHEFLIVEGAGGLAVPVKGRMLMVDMAVQFRLPILIVARAGLGSINHTLMSIEFARHFGAEVLGVIINNYPKEDSLAEQTNPAVIAELGGVTILGIIPHDPEVDVEAGSQGSVVELVREHVLLDRIIGPGAC